MSAMIIHARGSLREKLMRTYRVRGDDMAHIFRCPSGCIVVRLGICSNVHKGQFLTTFDLRHRADVELTRDETQALHISGEKHHKSRV